MSMKKCRDLPDLEIMSNSVYTNIMHSPEKIPENLHFEIDEKRFYYSLDLNNDTTGDEIGEQAMQEGFERQNARHVTILGGETKYLLKAAVERLGEAERAQTFETIRTLIHSLSWQFAPKDIYKIRKQDYFGGSPVLEDRQSYIATLDMPDMEVFYARLNSLLGTNFPPQMPHITLFTKGEAQNATYAGIPISSVEDFAGMSPEKVSLPTHE